MAGLVPAIFFWAIASTFACFSLPGMPEEGEELIRLDVIAPLRAHHGAQRGPIEAV